MQWSDIPFSPPPRTLRQFAVLWMLFFGGWACWQWLMKGNGGMPLLFLAMAFSIGPVGLLLPQLIRPIFVGWMCLAFPLGWAISQVILAFLFYAVLTPVGLLFRLIGRDALGRRPHSKQDTYWLPKATPTDVRSYFRQS
jgi:hypothetical protein